MQWNDVSKLAPFLATFVVFPIAACGDTDSVAGDSGDSRVHGEASTMADAGATGEESEASVGTGGNGETGSSSADETGSTEATSDTGASMGLSCGEVIACMSACLSDLGADCVGQCVADADPEEAGEATALATCVAVSCAMSGDCDLAADLDSPECMTCIGIGLLVPSPPGCEEEAAACYDDD